MKKKQFQNIFFIFLLILPFVGNSQNIFDSLHTAQYALYLYETQQYEQTISEYERLIFLSPNNTDAKLQLVRAYRKNEQYEKGINKINYFRSDENFHMNNEFSHEYMKLLLLSNQTIRANNFSQNNNGFTSTEIGEYSLSILLLEAKYNESQLFISNNNIETDYYYSLTKISGETQNLRYKSPVLAMSLSIILPGLGKVYTKDWKDGLMSLFFVGVNAFQAYRGFSQKGVESIYGWVFCGISFGFYTGNIVGSFKSAKRFNNRINYDIQKRVQNTVYNSF